MAVAVLESIAVDVCTGVVVAISEVTAAIDSGAASVAVQVISGSAWTSVVCAPSVKVAVDVAVAVGGVVIGAADTDWIDVPLPESDMP